MRLDGRELPNLEIGRCQPVPQVRTMISNIRGHLLHMRVLHTTDATGSRFNVDAVLNFIHESFDAPRKLFYARDALNAIATIDVVQTTAHALTEALFYSYGSTGAGFPLRRRAARSTATPRDAARLGHRGTFFAVDMPTPDGHVQFDAMCNDGRAESSITTSRRTFCFADPHFPNWGAEVQNLDGSGSHGLTRARARGHIE